MTEIGVAYIRADLADVINRVATAGANSHSER